jgi:hypothetical protein
MEIVQGPHHHELMIRPDALGTKDAFAQIPRDEWIEILNLHVGGHPVVVDMADAQLRCQLTKLTPVAFVTYDA